MLIFRNNNHLGDCLLQLGLLKMLHKQYNVEVGFVVRDRLQWDVIKTAQFLSYKSWQDVEYNSKYTDGDIFSNLAHDFVADDSSRGKMSLVEMWAKSIPYPLKGEKKPFIQLTPEDYKEAHKLNLKGKVFIAPYKVTCLAYPEVPKGQTYLLLRFAHKGCYLLGGRGRKRQTGFYSCYGLPIRVVGVLLKEAKALYCLNNGITNLAWAVGQKNIYEWLGPITEWAKVPYSRRLN